MRSRTNPRLPLQAIGGRVGASIAVILSGFLPTGGCARDRDRITPTTLGTNFKAAPRGKMTPFPWPGQDLSRATPRADSPGVVDPRAALASGVLPLN